MSAVKQIQAVARDRAGKGAARAVRRQGQVPAVIYGGGQAAEPIALDFGLTKQLIFAGHFLTTILEIPTWWAMALMVPSFALFAAAGFYTAWQHWRGRQGR